MRPDLSARAHRYQGERYWVVKEPVGLNYYRFREEEYAILRMLDGRTSLDEIKARFEAEFPPAKLTVEELDRFIGNLHQSGVVIADAPGQGGQLVKRRRKRKRKELQSKLSNVLALRFRGIDPDRLLNWLYPKVRWAFSTPAVVISLLLACSALLLVGVQFDAFTARLPAFHEFFSAKNWLLMAGVLAVTKIFHEFGHGLACKHFGGECHEMGVMLLVLTPCLYCNVSDSWMLPNKWHRAAIGAAGMWVEIVIASIATFVWWFTEPGLLNYICLSIMFVSSVSTIVFNGNPLLRYDGYYILSDLMEVPNLRQKANSILFQKLGQWCLGLQQPADPFLPQRNQWLFALYTVASTIYRWVVLISILFFLHKVFEPYGLQIIGKVLVLVTLYGLVVHPLYKLYKYFSVPGRLYQVKKAKLYGTMAVCGLLLGLLFIPLPYHVACPVEIEPRDATTVYAEVPGVIEEVFVEPGDRVEAGAELARLSNLDVVYQIARLEGRRELNLARYNSLLQYERHNSDLAMREQEVVEKALANAVRQLEEQQADAEKLMLRAPVGGVVMPAAPHRDNTPEGMLPSWSGSPLDRKNRGGRLRESQPLCRIGDPTQLEALLVIDQSRIEFIAPRQQVEIMLDQYPGRVFKTTIEQISSRNLEVSPEQLSSKAGGGLETRTDAGGRERPASTSYQAKAYLDDPHGELRIGLQGTAKIHAAWQSLAARGWRVVSETFNFRL